MNRPKVYISGPITKGNRNWNYYQACEVERKLMLAGFAPLNPMRSMALPFAWQDDMPHDLWIEVDLPWVECSNAVLRLPGESKGADIECNHARDFGVPVFYELKDLEEWRDYRRAVGVT